MAELRIKQDIKDLNKRVDGIQMPSSLPANGGNSDTVDGKHASDFRPTTWTPSKADVGLSNVNDWAATSAVNDASASKYATAAGVKAAYDKANEALNKANQGFGGQKTVVLKVEDVGATTYTISRTSPKGGTIRLGLWNKNATTVTTISITVDGVQLISKASPYYLANSMMYSGELDDMCPLVVHYSKSFEILLHKGNSTAKVHYMIDENI